MHTNTPEAGAEEFSTLLDELYNTAKIKDDVKRHFTMIRLSSQAKERYGIEAEAYLELHSRYQEGVRHFIDVRALGSIAYKGIISASALAAAIATLNIFSVVADQRGKSIAASWNTLTLYSGKLFDGGRKSAIENLVASGEVLDRVDLSRAPLTRLDIKPSCKLIGKIPSGTFGFTWRQQDLSRESPDCPRAQMQKARFNGAWLYEADMRLANLSEAQFNRISKEEVVRAQGINLSKADLTEAKFIGADLSISERGEGRRSNLTGATLIKANLTDTDLRGADLRGADLRGADLSGANLRGVKLCSTKIRITGEASQRTIGYEPLKMIRADCTDKDGNSIDGHALLYH
jgi:uncharacterized protein YjbI with pentapeptide repeats